MTIIIINILYKLFILEHICSRGATGSLYEHVFPTNEFSPLHPDIDLLHHLDWKLPSYILLIHWLSSCGPVCNSGGGTVSKIRIDYLDIIL